GGLTFQFSDGWWKFGQESNLDVHDTHASWPNEGYPEDYTAGENNMNEEWWGVCAKGPTDANGLYKLYPRAAYYALRDAYRLAPYGPGTDLNSIRTHFSSIRPVSAALTARGDRAAYLTDIMQRVRVSGLRIDMSTYSTGGSNITTPDEATGETGTYPAFRGFDHLESFYAEIEARPAENITASVTMNVLGHVPTNPIDEIFYENRGRPRQVTLDGEPETMTDLERIKVYRARVAWDNSWFTLDGFYRSGHYHWGYEGDFFGLYREANYGPNIDIYNGEAPLGMEIAGKKSLAGLKVAMGPELWWGANPAVLIKYQRQLGDVQATAMYQEDLDNQSQAVSSIAIPLPPTRKATLHLATTQGPFGLEIGGIWSGDTKTGERFQVVTGEPGSYAVLQDEIKAEDAFGAKAKLTLAAGRWNWYVQGSARGLVADGGPTAVQTFTGWRLTDNGIGNQWNLLTGFTYLMGNLQIAPNFLWQKPVVGPIPGDVPAPGRPRNVLDDPFAVRENRETTAGELLITYDPTPATWMYTWDSDIREDAPFAASVGFIYRHHPTTQDAAIGILSDGRSTFAFPGAAPARDHWETYIRLVSKLRPGLGMIANLYGGTGEPNGDDDRLIHRYGGDLRVVSGTLKFAAFVKVNDWGPYDYHRDFNLTFPLQLIGDISYMLGTPTWFDLPQTRIGVRGTWRSLDEYSPRYCPAMLPNDLGVLECDPTAAGDAGREWEIRTYIQMAIGF
ncbi:MAG: glycosidase, partial [Bacteroidota bacterium]|nr:glycosidase [Bacteroidota bacterium]